MSTNKTTYTVTYFKGADGYAIGIDVDSSIENTVCRHTVSTSSTTEALEIAILAFVEKEHLTVAGANLYMSQISPQSTLIKLP